MTITRTGTSEETQLADAPAVRAAASPMLSPGRLLKNYGALIAIAEIAYTNQRNRVLEIGPTGG